MRRRSLLALAIVAMSSTAAVAGEVAGEWVRDDGNAKVRFASCGAAICGSITWLKDHNGPARIGEKVFFDMKPSGANAWAGTAFNPDDGKTYTGKMTMSGNHLVTAGCVFAGLLCKSVAWTRAR